MKINAGNINGRIEIPSSKSVLHRLIILSSLADKPTKIYCNNLCNDVLCTIDCVKKLSAKVEIFNGYIVVYPICKMVNDVTLDVKESGSTLRFMLPIVASLGITATFTGSKSIISRPITPIVNLLRKNGVDVSNDSLPLKISGKLKPNNYVIDGSLSSQFASGLLLSLAYLGNSTLKIENITSKNYIDITVDCIKKFGVDIKYNNKFIFSNTKILSPSDIACEGDWSSACFILSLGVLYGKTAVTNLDINSMQGDKIIVDIIKKMGGKISILDGEVVAEKSNLNAIDFDIKNYPDIAVILAVLMANAKGTSTIKSVDRLKIKESNRLQNIIDMLNKLGIKSQYNSDTLKIFGGKINSCNLDGKNDHRVAISSIISLTEVGGTVTDIKCIDKSYPTFIEDYKKLGGCYEI